MASVIQRSFAGGEIAPALYGRADQTKYQTGLKTLRNFIVLKHGGAANRMGTKHINEVKTSSLATYMMKFVFNDAQTYIIEIGNLYMRFYTAAARIVVSGVAAYAGGTPYAIADLVVDGGINYYCIQAGTGHTPASSPTYWYPLTGVIYEIPTPYATADLARLQFIQSGDTVTITHPSYDTRDLTRTGHTAWRLTTKTFAPSQAAPTAPTNTGAAGTGGDAWKITAIKTDTYEESLPTAATESSAVATSGAPITVNWTDAAGATEYNVYKRHNGVFAFIGIASDGATGFKDVGIAPDMTYTPPGSRDPFTGANNRPACSTYYQQRLILANQNANTEKIYTSRSAMYNNFSISSPLQDDDAVTFTMAGRKVNEVRHMIDLGTLAVLTASAEYIVEGDANGILRANQPPNPRQVGNNGASWVVPAQVNDSIVFVQARGSVVRDLRYEVISQGGQAGYKGRDLTVFAGHLFVNKTITRMDYAQIPNSIVWMIRSDGVLLGLTYLTEHEVWGWHRHDTDGTFEDVCTVPESGLDATYVIVRRTINGQTKRYIERFAPRDFTDIAIDATFLDSFLTYDGRNTSSTTLKLTTGSGWTLNDNITIEAGVGTPFTAGDVGNAFVLYVAGETVRIVVDSYTDTTHVIGRPDADVPAAARGTTTTTWTRQVDQITGLSHLEGADVSVFADGHVVANPNNDDYVTVTVASGAITLDRQYGVIHVGLPFLSDFETLDIDMLGKEIRALWKDVTSISLLVEASRGIFAGPDFDNLDELQPDPINTYGEPWPLKTGLVEMPIASTWNQTGSFAVRQKDPLPLTILSAIPTGDLGG